MISLVLLSLLFMVRFRHQACLNSFKVIEAPSLDLGADCDFGQNMCIHKRTCVMNWTFFAPMPEYSLHELVRRRQL